MNGKVLFLIGKNLNYGFPNHPLSSLRLRKTVEEIEKRKIFERKNLVVEETKVFDENILLLFHTKEHVEIVKKFSEKGYGYLDYGDTPAYKGVFEDSLAVCSATLIAVKKVWEGEVRHAFNIAGGLHHAFPNKSGGFCVFNDVALAISYLKKELKAKRILYVDIDAHHGDGVFYSFYEDPDIWIADVHQSPLYPGTGFEWEKGKGKAEGTKINFPLKPYSGDKELLNSIKKIIEFGKRAEPEIVILQAGADGIKGDPLTQLQYSLNGHLEAVRKIHELAENICEGKLVITGGGGYNLENVKEAWANILDFLTKK